MDEVESLSNRKKQSYKIFDDIAPSYDFLNHLLSAGVDRRWRKKLLKNLPNKNSLRLLDLACGTGDVSIALSVSSKIDSILGVDLSTKMLEVAQKKITHKGLTHKISLEAGDGVNLRFNSEFDVVTVAFGIRNFSDPNGSLRGMHNALKSGGQVMIMEFSLPKSNLLKVPYLFYFRKVLPFIGNLVSGHKDAYTYLNKTVEDFPYGDAFLDMMKTANFKNVREIKLTAGIASIYIGERI